MHRRCAYQPHWVQLTVTDQIAEIRLDNPPLNLVTEAITGAFRAAVDAVATRDYVRVVLLTAAGERAFYAGSDVKEFAAVPLSANIG